MMSLVVTTVIFFIAGFIGCGFVMAFILRKEISEIWRLRQSSLNKKATEIVKSKEIGEVWKGLKSSSSDEPVKIIKHWHGEYLIFSQVRRSAYGKVYEDVFSDNLRSEVFSDFLLSSSALQANLQANPRGSLDVVGAILNEMNGPVQAGSLVISYPENKSFIGPVEPLQTFAYELS